jgi:hypothetical protein
LPSATYPPLCSKGCDRLVFAASGKRPLHSGLFISNPLPEQPLAVLAPHPQGALFVHAQDRRHVAWTPKGYYAASPGAGNPIGWHVNRGWDRAPDFFSAARFYEHFDRPDIVKRVLDDLDEDTAIAEANRLAASKRAGEIAKRLPSALTAMAPG